MPLALSGSAAGPALVVMLGASLAWAWRRWPEAPVAVAAVVLMLLVGALPPERLAAVLTHELLWLMAGAGVLGAVLEAQGLIERVARLALRGRPRFDTLCWRLTGLVAATAWLLPSTTARAALCLPVFLGLAALLTDERQRRVLALLFPTTILLSAGGSLLGAGAHLIAVEALRAQGGPAPSYFGWLLWAGPFAAASCALATGMLLYGFVGRPQREAVVAAPSDASDDAAAHSASTAPWTPRQRRLLVLSLTAVVLWAAGAAWGLSPAVVALAAAALAAWPRFGGVPMRRALAGIDLRMLVFLAATLLLAEAVLHSGAASAIATALAAPARQWGPTGVLAAVATAALASHLLIVSRSARVAVLLPVLVLPLAAAQAGAAGTGALSAQILVMTAVLGSGYCQTLAVSAKPVALFATHPDSALRPGDLLRLSAGLLLPMWLLLMAFGLWVWPRLGA